MKWKPVQIIVSQGPGIGSGALFFTYNFWSFRPVLIFVKIHYNQGILKLRVILFHLLKRYAVGKHMLRGLKIFFNGSEPCHGDTDQNCLF